MSRELAVNPEPDLLRVLSFPGIVQQTTQDLAPLQSAATKLFEQALGEFSGMRERAMLIGGRLTVRSKPGSGTEVKLEIPLEMHV